MKFSEIVGKIKNNMVKSLSISMVICIMGVLSACGAAPEAANSNAQNEAAESVEAVADQEEEENLENAEDATAGDDAGDLSAEDATEVENLSIKDIYAEHGIKAGTCLSPGMIDNPKTAEMLLGQFNSVTLENAMKPEAILSKGKSTKNGEITVDFNKDMIKLLDWAKENNLALRGHTLVWYSQTPDWIFYEDFDTSKEFVTREVMLERMESYIRQVFEKLEEGGYSDMLYAYDVVNEAWMEDGSMRDNNYKQIIGDDYLWYAFYYARQYAPEHVDLYYNDYNEQFKAPALVKFVETLVDEEGNSLIDGIGLQAHLYTMDDMGAYFRAVDKLSETGLKLSLTELDVALGAWQNTLDATDDNLKTQGKFYYNLINGLLERADEGKINMDSLTFWGYVDSMSWRKEASPLLYDGNYEPKPAFFGAAQVEVE